MAEPIDQYLEGIELLDKELNASQIKCQALLKLTETFICTNPPPNRNKVLYAFKIIKSCQATVNRIKEKQLSKVKDMQQNVILSMLKSEELDNFSHDGKLFYASETTRFNVSDRSEVNDFVASVIRGQLQNPEISSQVATNPAGVEEYLIGLLKDSMSMFGNTLNADLIRDYQEKNSVTVKDGEGNDQVQQGLPPKGVGTYTSTTLNMRNKK